MNADRSELTRERSFRVRLTFVGNHVTLDPNFAPVLDPRARFHVYSRGDDAPIDTVPAYGRLVRIEWRSSAHDTDSVAVGRKAVRPGLESVWIEDETAARDTGQVFAPGFHQLVLPAPPRAGGGTVTVRFISDFVPTAWFAGPDPAQFPLLNDGGRGVTVTNWSGLVTTPLWPPDGRTYFAPDSFRFVPSRRRPVGGNFERRTFYEIFENRVYARNEGDAVHVGS